MTPRAPLRWHALRDAAAILGVSQDALRKQLERKQYRASDGVVEAIVDGVRGRKFAGRWRVSFGERWGEVDVVSSGRQPSSDSGRGEPRL